MGEHVRCVVLGMEDDFSRISLSTAELEEHDGDMKRDKVRTRKPSLCKSLHQCSVQGDRSQQDSVATFLFD